MPTKQQTQVIHFDARPYYIGKWLIVRLPESASEKLPSRGQVMVNATINDFNFQTPLEPDGDWGHWFRINDTVRDSINLSAGDTVSLTMEPTKNWPEPTIPTDIRKALEADSEALKLWQVITPMARWEWIRWIRSTGKDETRKKRIEVACSKLKSGERRPCCWNRNLCTEPSVSKNGVLIGPTT